MNKRIYLIMLLGLFLTLTACGTNENETDEQQTEHPDEANSNPDNTTPDEPETADKTLIVYYSFTNNVHTIVSDLQTQINADVIRVEPAEEDIDYAADNYAVGSALIAAIRNNPDAASSYPAIKTSVNNLSDYETVIIAAPLWWSNMAAPLQTFLFQHGADMVGKKIGLIVSSASSGISGVESDARRLIPGGRFMSPSLWIRSSQTSDCHAITARWLKEIGYGNSDTQ